MLRTDLTREEKKLSPMGEKPQYYVYKNYKIRLLGNTPEPQPIEYKETNVDDDIVLIDPDFNAYEAFPDQQPSSLDPLRIPLLGTINSRPEEKLPEASNPKIHKPGFDFTNTKNFAYKATLGIPSAIAAIADVSGIGLGIQDMPGEKFLGFIENNEITAATIPLFYLLQNLIIYGPSTIESMDETIKVLTSGELPADLPKITSAWKRHCANLLAFFPIAYTSFSDFVDTYYFITQLNWHPYPAALVGFFTTLTGLFSEGLEAHRLVRSAFADEPAGRYVVRELTDYIEAIEEKENLGKYFAPLVQTLGAVGAVEDCIASYISVTGIFSITSNYARYTFLAAGLCNGFCDYAFNSKLGLDALNDLFAKLSKGIPQADEIASFSMAMFSASLIGHIQHGLMAGLLATPGVSLPIALSELAVEILCWGVAAHEGVNNMIGLYPFYNAVLRKLQGKLINPREVQEIELTETFPRWKNLQKETVNIRVLPLEGHEDEWLDVTREPLTTDSAPSDVSEHKIAAITEKDPETGAESNLQTNMLTVPITTAVSAPVAIKYQLSTSRHTLLPAPSLSDDPQEWECVDTDEVAPLEDLAKTEQTSWWKKWY